MSNATTLPQAVTAILMIFGDMQANLKRENMTFPAFFVPLTYTFARYDTFDRTRRQETHLYSQITSRNTHKLDTNHGIIPQIIFICSFVILTVWVGLIWPT